MTSSHRIPRAGAAAFALGLFLVGPQAAGVAAADSQDDSSSAASASGAGEKPSPAKEPVNRRASRSEADSGRAAAAAQSAGEVVTRSPAVAGARVPTGARTARVGAAVPSVRSKIRSRSGDSVPVLPSAATAAAVPAGPGAAALGVAAATPAPATPLDQEAVASISAAVEPSPALRLKLGLTSLFDVPMPSKLAVPTVLEQINT